MDRVDCSVFEDQLDALVRSELPEAGMAQLLGHAARCGECAALLRVREHLTSTTLVDLERQVPDAWVASMHGDVRDALHARSGRPRHRPPWLAPALAAASVALLVSNGLALRALGAAQLREQDLVEQVLDQQRRLVADGPAVPGGMRLGVAARGAALRFLESGRDLTVAELRALLREVPAGTPVISASRAGALATSGFVPAAWRDALSRLDGRGEVTAGDLLAVLEGLELSDGTSVPTTRLLELLS